MNSILKNILPLGLSICLLCSCLATKDYSRPETYAVEQYRTQRISHDTSSWAEYHWEDIFRDSYLKQYITEALQANLDLLKAQQNLLISASLAKQSKSLMAPTVTGGFTPAYIWPSTETFLGDSYPSDSHYSDISLGLSLAWEADVWGRLTSLKKAAAAQYLASENMQRLIKSRVVGTITSNYYLLLSLDAKEAFLKDAIKNREEGLTTVRSLKESGSLSEVAVIQNESLLNIAQTMLIDVQREIKLRENILSVLIGRTPEKLPRNSWEAQKIIPPLGLGIPMDLLNNRPDIMSAEYELVRAFQLTNVANASFYPKISIQASGGLNSQNFDNLFSVNALFGNLIGNLTQPIFNQRRLRTQKEVSVARQQTAYLNYKQTVLEAYREVSDALYTYDAGAAKMTIQSHQNQQLRLAVKYSETLQDQGMASYLEVLAAKNNSLDIQLDIIDTKLSMMLSAVDLYLALGGGWK